jgi:hypothetical protein|nr:MAG TPA: hypothetical protein [Caudoviricetes sp.]
MNLSGKRKLYRPGKKVHVRLPHGYNNVSLHSGGTKKALFITKNKKKGIFAEKNSKIRDILIA